MISHFTGGTTAQPETDHVEPDWTGMGWDGRVATEQAWSEHIASTAQQALTRRALRVLAPCPIPEPTPHQAIRVAQHRTHTQARSTNPRLMVPVVRGFFDEEPSQRCREVCRERS
jgi:hypothetical protein